MIIQIKIFQIIYTLKKHHKIIVIYLGTKIFWDVNWIIAEIKSLQLDKLKVEMKKSRTYDFKI